MCGDHLFFFSRAYAQPSVTKSASNIFNAHSKGKPAVAPDRFFQNHVNSNDTLATIMMVFSKSLMCSHLHTSKIKAIATAFAFVQVPAN